MTNMSLRDLEPTEALPDADQLVGEFARTRCVFAPNAVADAAIARWRDHAVNLLARFGRDIDRPDPVGDLLSYRVITGDVVRDSMPELWSFYTAPATAAWVRRVTGVPSIVHSPHLMASININAMEVPSHRYHWHFDGAPFTLMLYLTSQSAASGGDLEFYTNLRRTRTDGSPSESEAYYLDPKALVGESKRSVLPQAGMLVLMDGTCTYHSVSPLLAPGLRLSVTMGFPATQDPRPPDLDDYLYGSGR